MEENINSTEEELNSQENENLQLPTAEDYHAMFSAALQFYENGEYEQASKTFWESYEKFPEQTEALVNYANCQYELLNTQEAITNWELAKEKDKYLINPYINLGNYYLINDNYIAAEKEFKQAFCINPHNEISLVNLAVTYEKMNNRSKAFLLYEFYLSGTLNVSSNTYKNIHKKITMHKLNAISQMKMGIFFERKKYYRKALQAYFESLRVFPNFAKTYNNVGKIFYKLEKYDLAKQYWLEAYKIDRKNISLCLNLGLCCEKLEDYVNAYSFYTAFIQKTRHNTQEVFLAQRAAEKIHTIIIANTELVENYKKQAENYLKQENYDDALIHFENLLLITHTTEISNQINDIKSKTNIIYEVAVTAYKMAQELYQKGKYEEAIEKCKLSNAMWRGSYFEQDIFNLITKCQTALGNTLNSLLKAKH